MGAARSGDLVAPRKDAEQLETFHKALLTARNAYGATEVEIQRLAAAGWIAYGEGKPGDALKEYEASQVREPNRFRNYLGSARAADMAGDRAKAAAYYQKLLALAKDSDCARPELDSAKKLAQR